MSLEWATAAGYILPLGTGGTTPTVQPPCVCSGESRAASRPCGRVPAGRERLSRTERRRPPRCPGRRFGSGSLPPDSAGPSFPRAVAFPGLRRPASRIWSPTRTTRGGRKIRLPRPSAELRPAVPRTGWRRRAGVADHRVSPPSATTS